MRKDILERKSEILGWIDENQSKSYMCKQLKCNQSTLNSWFQRIGISYDGNQSGKGIKNGGDGRRITAMEYTKTHGCKSAKLKKKLIEEGYIEDICVGCGNTGEWLGKSITLELDHIDGNKFNNELENLRVLCPNCHSQTPTYKGRGIKSKRKIYYCECGNEKCRRSKKCLKCASKDRRKKNGLMVKLVDTQH